MYNFRDEEIRILKINKRRKIPIRKFTMKIFKKRRLLIYLRYIVRYFGSSLSEGYGYIQTIK